MSFVGDFVGGLFGGNSAADASRDAANISAKAQMEALDYLKQTEAIPQELREGALTQLGGLYGLNDQGGQQQLINQAQNSPLYSAIMGGQQAGEQSILRNAAATGGLRSGGSVGALTDYGSQLQNQALLTSYNDQLQGLQGLAGLGSNSNTIAQQMGNIGATQAAGITAGANAQQQATGTGINTILGGLGLFMSDVRLKDNIEKVGNKNGVNIYRWVWNKAAEKFNLSGDGFGPLAQELELKYPDMIVDNGGYKGVNAAKFAEVLNG